jgi:hypothetical protein
LIFDDGFERSTIKTAEIFQSYGLRAAFAVLADPSNFVKGCGDWKLWNELQRRGHLICPHGLTHLKLTEVPPQQAIDSVRRGLDSFSENLEGFAAGKALWAFTYNTPTPETISWLLERVRAVRIGGDPLLSDADLASRIWRSQTDGPHDPFENCMGYIDRARRQRPTALFYCFHGLDGEMWGATKSVNLRRVLDIITSDSTFTYWNLSSTPAPSSPR